MSTKYKVVLIGDSAVGKTSIFTRFEHGEFNEDHELTVGGAYSKVSVKTQFETIEFGIWDTAGQEKFRNIVPMYFQHSNFVLIVFDITSTDSFQSVRDWAELIQDKAPEDARIILIGNKVDLIAERKIQKEQIDKAAQEIGAIFCCETSAKTGEGVQTLIERIAEECIFSEKQANVQINSVPEDSTEKTKSGCC